MTTPNSTSQAALKEWLKTRQADWQQLDARLKTPPNPDDALNEARALLVAYKAIISDLSLSKRIQGNTPITVYLQTLYLKTYEELHQPARQLKAEFFALYRVQVPVLLQHMRHSLLSALAIFLLGILAGWLLISIHPELIGLVLSEPMINQVQNGELWTDSLLNIMPSSVLSLGIAANNITVTLTAFVLGALYGLGTLYILGMNGFMLGSAFAFTAQHGLAGRLFAFIIGHGPVELSVILIAGAMGLQLGESLIRPGPRNRLHAFRQTSFDTGKILCAATPFLLLAGLIEGYISPNPVYPLAAKLTLGILTALVFWWMLGAQKRTRLTI